MERCRLRNSEDFFGYGDDILSSLYLWYISSSPTCCLLYVLAIFKTLFLTAFFPNSFSPSLTLSFFPSLTVPVSLSPSLIYIYIYIHISWDFFIWSHLNIYVFLPFLYFSFGEVVEFCWGFNLELFGKLGVEGMLLVYKLFWYVCDKFSAFNDFV